MAFCFRDKDFPGRKVDGFPFQHPPLVRAQAAGIDQPEYGGEKERLQGVFFAALYVYHMEKRFQFAVSKNIWQEAAAP